MSYYKELFDHMSHYHGLKLLEGEMDDIVTIALEMERNRKATHDRVADVVRWVAVSENIPPDKFTDVIVKLKNGNKKYGLFDGDGRFYDTSDNDITDEVESYLNIPD